MTDTPLTGRVALLPTCVLDTVAPEVGEAVVKVLRRLGADVAIPERATCCGQPAWNAGFAEEAAAVAHTTLEALAGDPAEVICVPAGSCATMIRVFWPELFHLTGDHAAAEQATALAPRIKEFSELLQSCGQPSGLELEASVAYHHSCHMLRELGLHDEPLAALAAVKGCTTVAWEGDDRCCGFGGMFSVKLPETSLAMADDKLDALAASGATHLVGCDTSCLLHLQGRLRRRGDQRTQVRHLAEILAEAQT